MDHSVKIVNISLELLNEQTNMISVTNCMMCLYCKGKHSFAVSLEEFSDCENGEQKMTVIKNVYIESGKFHPWHHRNIEGIGWRSGFGRILGGGTVFLGIHLVVLQENLVVL